MKFRHIIVPDIQRIGGSRQRVGTTWGVESNPHTSGVVSRISHKPSVNVVVGGSGLSGTGHIGQCFSMGGSASQNSFQNVGQLMSSRRLIDLLLFCFRPDDHIALTVSDQGDAGWLTEHPFIFHCSISRCHLQTTCTFTQSTQCSG